MTPPKVLLLCSGRLAVPAVYRLVREGALLGIAVPDTDPKTTQLLRQLASSLHCPFHCLSRQQFVAALTGLCTGYQPDAVLVIGFPWRIPERILALPQHGFLNFHGGLLPELRGPDPIFEAIRQALPETALTVHRMDAGWDTGPIVYEDRFPLTADLTHGLLGTQLAFRCEQALPVLLRHMQQGSLPLRQQKASPPSTYRPRVATTNLYIDWHTQTATAIAALIRACNPVYGGAATIADGWTFRLVDALAPAGVTHNAPAGTLLALDDVQGALIQCSEGTVLQARIIGTDEGYFPAGRLPSFGLAPGLCFQHPAPASSPLQPASFAS